MVFVGCLLRSVWVSDGINKLSFLCQFVTRERSIRPYYLLMTSFPGKRDALKWNVSRVILYYSGSLLDFLENASLSMPRRSASHQLTYFHNPQNYILGTSLYTTAVVSCLIFNKCLLSYLEIRSRHCTKETRKR